jgi:hypothetical protein
MHRWLQRCFVLLLFSNLGHAGIVVKGNKLFLSPPDNLIEKLKHLFNPAAFDYQTADGKEPYSEAKAVLVLSDNFNPSKNDSGTQDLAKSIQGITTDQTKILKTGIGCPDSKVDKTDKNITYKKLDNTKPFELLQNHFDIIVMNKGLCHCDGSATNCAGIDLRCEMVPDFLEQVADKLNKNNPNAIVFLHGQSKGFPVEAFSQRTWNDAISKASNSYPAVDMKMIYLLKPQLHGASQKGSAEIDESNYIFMGIYFTVKIIN